MGECELRDNEGILMAKARGTFKVKAKLLADEGGRAWISC